MLTVSKLGTQSHSYYLRQCQNTEQSFNPTQVGEPPGVWIGSAPKLLGLPETVLPKHLRLLMDGRDQYGEKLVTNAGKVDRVLGWDCVFAAPKSVSLLWALLPPIVQTQIETLHHHSMNKAIEYLESQSVSRRGADGVDRQLIKLAIAAFQHSTNQDNEPHLHTHALVINTGVGKGFFGAIDSSVLYRHQKTAGALYRAEFAAKLESELGFRICRSQQSFEIEPFSRERGSIYRSLMNHISSRRVAIEQREPQTTIQAAQIAKATRSTKELRSRQEVCEQTRSLASRYGVTQKHIERLIQPGREIGWLRSLWSEWRCLREARTEVVRFQSHFSKRDLVCSLAQAAQGKGINADRILELAEKVLASRYVRSLGEHRGEQRFTTNRIYQQEQSLMRSIAKIQSRSFMLVRSQTIEAAIHNHHLSNEQAQSLKMLCQHPAGIKVLTGLSGTGKTQVLAALSDSLTRSGYQVLTLSASTQAAQALSDRTSLTQSRLSSLLDEKPQHLTIGQFLWRAERSHIALGRSSMVVVDDAHKLSLTQLSNLASMVENSRSKLILSGDRQVPQSSGGFHAIARTQKVVELKDLHRQVQERDRTLVQDIADGRAMRALKDLAERNQLSLHTSRRDAIHAIVEHWAQNAPQDFKNHRIIVDSNQVAREVNQKAQEVLQQQGVLQGTPMRVGSSTMLYVGDRIQFQQHQRLDGICKGDTATVLKLNKFMQTATVQLDSGDRRVISLSEAKGIALNYAVRSTQIHVVPAQAYVLTEGISRETTLAHITQFRERLRLHSWRADDRLMGDLAKSMQIDREQKLAIEVERSRYQES